MAPLIGEIGQDARVQRARQNAEKAPRAEPALLGTILSGQRPQAKPAARPTGVGGFGRIIQIFDEKRKLQALKDRIAGRRDPEQNLRRARARLSRGRRSTILGGSTGSTLQTKRLLGE